MYIVYTIYTHVVLYIKLAEISSSRDYNMSHQYESSVMHTNITDYNGTNNNIRHIIHITS